MLTDEQTRSFDEAGFLVLPGLLAAAEVEGLREAVDGLIARLEELPPQWREDFHRGGLFGDAIGVGEQLCRIEYTFQKHPRFLMLLGNPRLLEVPASLHDGPVVVTWEDMVLKMPGSGHSVPMHQDALFQSVGSRVFSVGIYLDSSHDDPLIAYPGTHWLGPLEDEEVEAAIRARQGEAVSLPVDAGDAILHNVRVIHGSDPHAGQQPRRVLYIEFRTVDQVLHDSPWDASWLQRRLPYIPLGVQLRQRSELAAGDDPELVRRLRKRRPEWFAGAPDAGDVDLRVHHHDIVAPA